ncbi:MAG TPA: transketolase C-terminal domain-containing protein, partial [Spirochaetia bacterium]|nr:transketolase C-terminal domain-containing protein [Spirochaetia bacterium]
PRVVVVDPDVGEATRTWTFGENLPDRFFEFGIAEQNAFGAAAGMAAVGCIVFASTFAVFASMRAAEMIRTSICYPKLNVKVVGGYAGISNGKDGATHQSVEDMAIMRSFPNMTVVAVGDPVTARKVVEAAVKTPGPVYIRMEYEQLPEVHPEDLELVLGRGYVVKTGSDVTLVSYGTAIHRLLEARSALAESGISAEVIDFPTLKPFDSQTLLGSVRKTGALVTLEDHSVIGGLASAASECLIEAGIAPQFRSLGFKDVFTESGKTPELRELYGLDSTAVVRAAREVAAGVSISQRKANG